MLTTFGRQLVMIMALLGLAVLISLSMLTSQGRALAAKGQETACQQARVCIVVYRR